MGILADAAHRDLAQPVERALLHGRLLGISASNR